MSADVRCYLDVTETLRSGWRAGIQRVVCEIVRSFEEANPDIELVLVRWSKVHRSFRRLDDNEVASVLAPTTDHQPRAKPPPRTFARKALAWSMHASGAGPLVYRRRRRAELAAVPEHHWALLIDDFERGSVFLDADATWNPSTVPRPELIPALAERGVATCMFIYDLLPITHPQWFLPELVDVWTAHLHAHLDSGSSFVCDSAHTERTLQAYANERGTPVESVVAPMGASAGVSAASDRDAFGTKHESTDEVPFWLTVGTIEPRKNHEVILDAFDLVRDEVPSRLVVVGRYGWHNDHIAERLEAGGTHGIEWRPSVSDDELDHLYRSSFGVIVASITEGFGLPVVEALQRGTVVLSSTGGALPEAGGRFVEYFEPSSPTELADLMRLHLTDPDHHRRQKELVADYSSPTWTDTARATGTAIRRLHAASSQHGDC